MKDAAQDSEIDETRNTVTSVEIHHDRMMMCYFIISYNAGGQAVGQECAFNRKDAERQGRDMIIADDGIEDLSRDANVINV